MPKWIINTPALSVIVKFAPWKDAWLEWGIAIGGSSVIFGLFLAAILLLFTLRRAAFVLSSASIDGLKPSYSLPAEDQVKSLYLTQQKSKSECRHMRSASTWVSLCFFSAFAWWQRDRHTVKKTFALKKSHRPFLRESDTSQFDGVGYEDGLKRR